MQTQHATITSTHAKNVHSKHHQRGGEDVEDCGTLALGPDRAAQKASPNTASTVKNTSNAADAAAGVSFETFLDTDSL